MYNPVPGVDPNQLGPNEFTAGSVLTLNCTLGGGSGDTDQHYEWSMTKNDGSQSCPSCTESSSSMLTLILYSYTAGNYTCTTSDWVTSENVTVTVVGELPITKNACIESCR